MTHELEDNSNHVVILEIGMVTTHHRQIETTQG